jgi:hypothetical protein
MAWRADVRDPREVDTLVEALGVTAGFRAAEVYRTDLVATDGGAPAS